MALPPLQSGLARTGAQIAQEQQARQRAAAGAGHSGQSPSLGKVLETAKEGQFWNKVAQTTGAAMWELMGALSLGIIPACVTFAAWVKHFSAEVDQGGAAEDLEKLYASGQLLDNDKRYAVTARTKGVDLSDKDTLDNMRFFYATVDKDGNLCSHTGAKINAHGVAVDAQGNRLPPGDQPRQDIDGITNLRRRLLATAVRDKHIPTKTAYEPLVTWLKRPLNEFLQHRNDPRMQAEVIPHIKQVQQHLATALETDQVPAIPGISPENLRKLARAPAGQGQITPHDFAAGGAAAPVATVLHNAIQQYNHANPGNQIPEPPGFAAADLEAHRAGLQAFATTEQHIPNWGQLVQMLQPQFITPEDWEEKENVHEILQAAITRNNANPPRDATGAQLILPTLPTPLSNEKIAALNNMREELHDLYQIAQIQYAQAPVDEEAAKELKDARAQLAEKFGKELKKADAAIKAADNAHFSLEDNLKMDLVVLEQMRIQREDETRRALVKKNQEQADPYLTEEQKAASVAVFEEVKRQNDGELEKIQASSQAVRAWYLQTQGLKFEAEKAEPSWANKLTFGMVGGGAGVSDDNFENAKIYTKKIGAIGNRKECQIEYFKGTVADPRDPTKTVEKILGVRCSQTLRTKERSRDLAATTASQVLALKVPTAPTPPDNKFHAKLTTSWTAAELTKILDKPYKDPKKPKDENKTLAYKRLEFNMQQNAMMEILMQDCFDVKTDHPDKWNQVSQEHKAQLLEMKKQAKEEIIKEVFDPAAQAKFGKAFNKLDTLERAALAKSHMELENKDAEPYLRQLASNNKDKIKTEKGIENADDAIARVNEMAAAPVAEPGENVRAGLQRPRNN